MTGFIDPTKESFSAFRAADRQGPNSYAEPRASARAGGLPRRTAGERSGAYAAYGRESLPVFSRLGGTIVWSGQFELMLIGPPEERWDRCFIARYPEVAAFVEMIRDPVYREAVKHRQAAVEDSRLIRLAPGGAGSGFGSIPAWSRRQAWQLGRDGANRTTTQAQSATNRACSIRLRSRQAASDIAIH